MIERPMTWWPLFVRGLVAIVFGIFALAVPNLTLAGLILLFAAYAFVEGVVNIVGAIKHRHGVKRWGVLLFEGIVSVAAAVVAVIWPAITALALVYVIAAWAFVTGILEIVAAVRLRRVLRGEWLLGLAGIASIALGVLMALYPASGALALVVWIAAYAIIAGVLMVILSIRLRSLEEPLEPTPFGREQPAG